MTSVVRFEEWQEPTGTTAATVDGSGNVAFSGDISSTDLIISSFSIGRGHVASTSNATNFGTITAGTETTLLSLTFSSISGRMYYVQVNEPETDMTVAGYLVPRIRVNGSLARRFSHESGPAQYRTLSYFYPFTSAITGSTTVSFTMDANTGSYRPNGNAGAALYRTMSVFDIGG